MRFGAANLKRCGWRQIRLVSSVAVKSAVPAPCLAPCCDASACCCLAPALDLRVVRTLSTTLRARGARRAGLAAVHAGAPRDRCADCGAALHPPAAGWPPGDRDAPGAGCLPLAPSGHVGAVAHSTPRPTARAARRNVSGGARAARGAIPPAPDPEALQDQRQGRSLRSRPSASLRADPCP